MTCGRFSGVLSRRDFVVGKRKRVFQVSCTRLAPAIDWPTTLVCVLYIMALRKATGANVSVATGRRRRRREKIRPIVTKGAPVKREGPPSLNPEYSRMKY